MLQIGQPEICGYFNHPNSIDINYGGSAKFDDLKISMVPAHHTSSFPDGTYGSQPCGYMFRFQGKKIIFCWRYRCNGRYGVVSRLFGEITALFFQLVHIIPCVQEKRVLQQQNY